MRSHFLLTVWTPGAVNSGRGIGIFGSLRSAKLAALEYPARCALIQEYRGWRKLSGTERGPRGIDSRWGEELPF